MRGAGHLYGPVYASADPNAHIGLLTQLAGMEVAEVERLDAAESQKLWGTEVHSVTMTTLRTPGVDAGAVVLDFGQPSAPLLRDDVTRLHRDALRVVDYYAPDLDAAIAHARALGYAVESDQAGYELSEGAFREVHIAGPDGTVTAFLTGDESFFAGFVQVGDRILSEVLSVSFPVSDLAGTRDWYAAHFGWDVVYEYSFDDPSFGRMVGLEGPVRVVSQTVGAARNEPYVNLVDYGLDLDPHTSLAGRVLAPRRGLLGLAVRLDDATADRAVILSPQGVPHLVIAR